VRAYIRLHNRGYAHSIESWCEGELAGGLYGVSLGRAFFGESMFSRRTDASKAALAGLVALARAKGISLIDCQLPTPHLQSLGAKEVARDEFLRRLKEVIDAPTDRGRWAWPAGLSLLRS
jgi:leucyl/phenylalanyl-tRNA--protein transferase